MSSNVMSDLDPEMFEQLDHFATVLEETDQNLPKDCMIRMIDELRFSKLSEIYLKGSNLSIRLGDTNVITLVGALISAEVSLHHLSLTFHRITDIGMEEITRLLQPSIFGGEGKESHETKHSLTYLNLEGNDINGDIIDKTCLVSRFDCPLNYLNLSSNPISSKGQENIALITLNNQNLQHLLINSSGFDLKGLIALSANLYENKSLVSLSLDRPILNKSKEGEVTEHLSKILLQHHCLAHLSMKYHSINDYTAKLLADSLNVTQTLISLNLECNSIGVAGAEALASNLLIQENRCIQFLGLSFNFVSDDGAIALADSIKANTALRTLTLKNNKIGYRGLLALANALECSRNLESISLFGNHFDNDSGKRYFDLCNNRFPYMNMHIDLSVYVVDGVYNIAEH